MIHGRGFSSCGSAFALLAGCLCGLASGPAQATDWARWRGPFGNGTTDETGWDTAALAGRPKIVWEANVGVGYAAVAVRGDRLYTIGNSVKTGAGDDAVGMDTVYCLDTGSGREIWRFSYPCTTDDSFPGPTATPVLDGDRLYTLSDDTGDLFCLGADNGSVRWHLDVDASLGAVPPHSGFGFSGSPVIENDLLLLNLNTAGVALDKHTGKTVWSSEPGRCSYSTPVVFDHRGKRRVALFGAKKLFILNSATGAVDGSFPWQTFGNENSADPLVLGDRIFISSSYEMGCAMLKLTEGDPELLWQNRALGNLFTSSVLIDGHIYGVDGLRRRNALKCLDTTSGEERWSRTTDFASLIAAGNRLIILTERGVLHIAEATPQEYRELTSARVQRTADLRRRGAQTFWWTNPVLSGGKLYLRSDKGDLVCIDLR